MYCPQARFSLGSIYSGREKEFHTVIVDWLAYDSVPISGMHLGQLE